MAPAASDTDHPGAFRVLSPLYFVITFLGGFLNLILVLCSVFSKDVHRTPSFTNFCAVLVVSSIGYGLLAIVGQPMTENPTFGICLAQSAAVHGNAIMVMVGYTILQYLIWRHVRDTYVTTKPRIGKGVIWLLLPYIAYLLTSVPRLITSAFNRQNISRDPHLFYCSVKDDNTFEALLSISTAVLGIMGLVLEFLTFRLLVRVAKSTKDATEGARISETVHKGILLRILLLTVWILISVFVTILDTIDTILTSDQQVGVVPTRIVSDLLVACVPLTNGMLFITQKDYRMTIREGVFHLLRIQKR